MIVRSECELNMIVYAIYHNTLGFMISAGVGPSYFDNYYRLAEKIFKKWERDKCLPSMRLVQREYPDIVFPPPPEERDIKEYIYDLKRHHLRTCEAEVLRKMGENYKAGNYEEIARKNSHELYELISIVADGGAVDLTGDSPDRYETFRKKASGEEVYPTSFAHPDLNEYVGGMNGGDLIVYVARSGATKSFTSLGDAIHCWKNAKVPVLLVSYEMPPDQIGYRFDSFNSAENGTPGFSNFGLRHGYAVRDDSLDIDKKKQKATEQSAEEYRRYIMDLEEGRRLRDLPPFYVITPQTTNIPLTPEYIHTLAKDLGVGLVVVDYMMLVPHRNNRLDMRLRLAEVSAAFKQSALSLDIPYIVPHQLNRESEKANVITLAHFAESDAVGQNTDIGILIEKEGDRIVKYKFLKVRGGPTDKKFAWSWDIDSGVRTPLLLYEYDGEDEEEGEYNQF